MACLSVKGFSARYTLEAPWTVGGQPGGLGACEADSLEATDRPRGGILLQLGRALEIPRTAPGAWGGRPLGEGEPEASDMFWHTGVLRLPGGQECAVVLWCWGWHGC